MYNQAMRALGDAPSAIRELFAYGQRRAAQIGAENVFDFSIGNPSVPAPAQVGEALSELGQADPVSVHAYTQSPGSPAVRQAIADDLNARFGTSYSAANLYLTCGAAASLSITLKALIEPGAGDEVIVIAPFFPEYRTWIEAHGATLVQVDARASDFQIDVDALEAALSPRTKAVIINTPNNPVGCVYSRQNLEAAAEALRAASGRFGRTVYLMSDEPYRELVYDGAEVPWVPAIYESTIVCYSWSKSLSLPGERIGYVLVPPEADDAAGLFNAVSGAGRALGFVNAPATYQQVIVRCLGVPADTAAYARNRELLCAIMDEVGLRYIAPQGAFYLWVQALEPDAQAFSERAKAHELLLVPSDSFGVTGWVRLGYCVSPQTIERSRGAFAALVADYKS